MLIAIAAAAVLSAPPVALPQDRAAAVEKVLQAETKLFVERTNRCAAKVMDASAPGVRYDRGAADPGAMDQQPYRGEAQLFSAVELKVEGCSLPVIRARVSNIPPVEIQASPVDH